MTNEQINDWVATELGDWGENTNRLLIEAIQKKKLTLTTELLRSLQFQVFRATEHSVNRISFAFQGYGRIREMKTLFYDSMPPVEELEKFVAKVGLEKFKYVPGYKNKARVPSESQAIKRIAWGIALSKSLKNKNKPKKWFAKNFYGQINLLIDKLLVGYQDSAIENVKESFN